jgi:hypothetical protein
MKGNGDSLATHEVHLFFAPVMQELDKDAIAKYKAAVSLWNERNPGQDMKAPVLTLIFRDGKEQTPITVCQSARYVRSNDMDFVKQQALADQAFFEAQGLTVIRVKIEASAYGIDGIPKNAEEAAFYSQLYFEFHIKVQKKGQKAPELIGPEEERELRQLANQLSISLAVPVPLSYNREKNESNANNGGCQRFLNVRSRGRGLAELKPWIDNIKQVITQFCDAKFSIVKVISEFVWFDTMPKMDHGWIDYSPEELAALQSGLLAGAYSN